MTLTTVTPTPTNTGGIDDPVLSEEVRIIIFVLSGIFAFIIVVVLVLASCVCSLRILYNRGKISTDSRVIKNRPLLQRMISGDRAPRVQYPHEPDHDYENLDAELGIINPQGGGSGFIYQPRSDISDQERVSQIYNWSRGSGGSSSHIPGHLLRATPSVSIPGSQTNLQQPFNRNSYAASESEIFQKLFPNSEQNLGSNEHPHWHLHTKSYIRRTQQPLFVRQRSKSVDLTPIMETRETPVIEKCLTPAPIDENRVLRRHSLKTESNYDSPDGSRKDPDWRPPLLREISLSADNLPALCLNNCPLTPSPLRENCTLAAAVMSPLREERFCWVHKPKLGMLAENSQSAESSSEEGSNTSSRTTSAASVEETAEKQPLEGKDFPPVRLPDSTQLSCVISNQESGYDTYYSDTEGITGKLSIKHHELPSVYTILPSSPPATQRDSRSNSSPLLPIPTHLQEHSSIHLQHCKNREHNPFYQQKYSPAHLTSEKTPTMMNPLTPAPIAENLVLCRSSLKTEADCDSPDGPGEDPNWRQPLLREFFLSADNLPALCLYETQSKASHILSGNVFVFNSHFNQLASSEDMNTSAHKKTSAPLIKSIDTVECGNEGGMYINRTHDITIKIPEKAIPEGIVLQLSISATLYGPFLFPEGVRPVSPILWLCTHPTLTFSKPIELVLPHYLHCESQKDTDNLMFLKADHNPSTDGKIHFKPADGESVFMHHTSYGTLHTKHCCFLCIAAKKTEKDTLNANFCLITAYPRNPLEHSWSVYFGVTYLLPTCIQAFKNQFKDDYRILRARKFRMQDAAERKIEIFYPKNLPQQWFAGLNGTNEILASDVDFWSIWNRDPTELKVMEQEKMYPPNFDVIIDGRSAVGDARLTASFSGIDCPLKVEIPLLLPASTQHEVPKEPIVPTRTAEQDDTIELRELCLELHTVDDWFNLGIYLHIPYSKLKIIEAEHNHNPLRCRTEMFQAWLDNFQPSWSAVIEALTLLQMSQLARRLAAKKISASHVPPHVQRSSPTHSQRYSTNFPAQFHQSHQYRFDVRGRSSPHPSEVAMTETLC